MPSPRSSTASTASSSSAVKEVSSNAREAFQSFGWELHSIASKVVKPVQGVANRVAKAHEHNNKAVDSKADDLYGNKNTNKLRKSALSRRVDLPEINTNSVTNAFLPNQKTYQKNTGEEGAEAFDEAAAAATADVNNLQFRPDHFHEKEDSDFHKHYVLGKLIYKNKYCRVHLCRNRRLKQNRIVKVVREVEDYCREYELLKTLDSPFTPTVYACFQGQDNHEFWMVMDYYTGGTVLSRLEGQNKSLLGSLLTSAAGETLTAVGENLTAVGESLMSKNVPSIPQMPPPPSSSSSEPDKRQQDDDGHHKKRHHNRETAKQRGQSPKRGQSPNPNRERSPANRPRGHSPKPSSSPKRSPNPGTGHSPRRDNKTSSPVRHQHQHHRPHQPRGHSPKPSSSPKRSPNPGTGHSPRRDNKTSSPIRHQHQHHRPHHQPHDTSPKRTSSSNKESTPPKERPFSEEDVQMIMLQVLSCLNYCHNNHIIHGDVRPANIMMNYSPKDVLSITLIDFDSSYQLSDDEEKINFPRDSEDPLDVVYLAPEILQDRPYYDTKSDIWSVGITMYKMLSNTLPFLQGDSDTALSIRRRIVTGETIMFPEEHWGDISNDAVEYILFLLNPRPSERPNAQSAISHHYLTGARTRIRWPLDNPQESGAETLLRNLQNFERAGTKIKEAIFFFMASHLLTTEEKKTIDAVFKALDTGHQGKILKHELKAAFYHALKVFISEKEATKIMERMACNHSSYISYAEFLMYALPKSELLSKKRLKKVFDLLDKEGKGYVTDDEVRTIFTLLIKDFAFVDAIITKVSRGGKFFFDDFVELMMRNSIENGLSDTPMVKSA